MELDSKYYDSAESLAGEAAPDTAYNKIGLEKNFSSPLSGIEKSNNSKATGSPVFIFSASLKNELKKLTSRKKYVVMLIIQIIICLIWGAINIAIGKASAFSPLPISTDITLSSMPTSMLGFVLQLYLPLIIFMAACDLFVGEVHDGTIRAEFMRPVSRFKIYFSKTTAIFIMSLVYLVALFVITIGIKAVVTHSVSGMFVDFATYVLDALPMIVLILFASMINQFTKSTSLSVILCIIIYIGLMCIGIVEPIASGLLFTGYLQWHTLWIGFTLPFMAMMSKLGILVGYSIVFASIGYFLYERKEV